MILFIFIIQISLALVPGNYYFTESDRDERNSGLPSNSVIDIETIRGFNSDYIFLTSSSGLGYSYESGGNFVFRELESDFLPEGGNPAMTIKDNVIAVSGSVTVLDAGSYYPAGTGVSYSLNYGSTWQYMPQPVDDIPTLWSCSNYEYNSLFFNSRSECEQSCTGCNGQSASCSRIYDFINWGNQSDIVHLSVTTPINNVSYDIAIHGDYIYSTSWAGGLRRFDYTLINPVWEVVPLPMDNQDELLCNAIDIDSYEINPVGDCDSEGDNHKAFSVFGINDTLWVGTAGGINKGIVDNDCIDWTHLESYDYGFYDDWIIDFEYQTLDNETYDRIWAITWDKDTQGTLGPPSFSNDGGQTWDYPNQLVEMEVKSYNISFNGDDIYLATNQGLFLSRDTQTWERFNDISDYQDGEQILSEIVYDSKVIDGKLWVGTQDGVGVSSNPLNPDWLVYRFWEKNNSFDVYPNPFLRDDYNVLNGDGHVRFIYSSQNVQSSVDIFDFSMDKVATLTSPNLIDDQIEFIWNGENEYGSKVKNGVYFCRINDNGQYSWAKLAVLGSL